MSCFQNCKSISAMITAKKNLPVIYPFLIAIPVIWKANLFKFITSDPMTCEKKLSLTN